MVFVFVFYWNCIGHFCVIFSLDMDCLEPAVAVRRLYSAVSLAGVALTAVKCWCLVENPAQSKAGSPVHGSATCHKNWLYMANSPSRRLFNILAASTICLPPSSNRRWNFCLTYSICRLVIVTSKLSAEVNSDAFHLPLPFFTNLSCSFWMNRLSALIHCLDKGLPSCFFRHILTTFMTVCRMQIFNDGWCPNLLRYKTFREIETDDTTRELIFFPHSHNLSYLLWKSPRPSSCRISWLVPLKNVPL